MKKYQNHVLTMSPSHRLAMVHDKAAEIEERNTSILPFCIQLNLAKIHPMLVR